MMVVVDFLSNIGFLLWLRYARSSRPHRQEGLSQINMEKKGDSWFVSLDLAGGKHLYKFIVDGKWVLDPENRMKENDHTGISHSVLIVR